MKICKNVDDPTRDDIIQIIQKYWDCFCKEGARRTILGYEFGIDTGDSKPVCCKKTTYGPYKSKIIMEQVQKLQSNGWVKRCKGPWGSLIVLAANPHQEHFTDIDNFIWRICVSYQKLNDVTKPFQYPTQQYDDDVTVINIVAHRI